MSPRRRKAARTRGRRALKWYRLRGLRKGWGGMICVHCKAVIASGEPLVLIDVCTENSMATHQRAAHISCRDVADARRRQSVELALSTLHEGQWLCECGCINGRGKCGRCARRREDGAVTRENLRLH